MGVQDITAGIGGYDFVVAVTERAINVALDTWLKAQGVDIALYYTKDSSGAYVAVDSQADATIYFTGTLAPTRDADHKPIDLITLYTSPGSRTVQYNLTVIDGVFQASSGMNYVYTTGDPWVIHFYVDLAQASVAYNALPLAVQKQFADSSLYSFKQLGVDLSTAKMESLDNIEGPSLTSDDLADLTAVMAAYLAQQQQTAQMIFGLTACFTSSGTPPYTLTPTSLDFCISQYTPPPPSSPPAPPADYPSHALDTLNYLAMTGGRTPPATPTNGMGFNWVDSLDEMGGMAINRHLIVSANMLVSSIAPVLGPISLTPHASKGSGDNGEIQLLPCNNYTEFVVNSQPGSLSSSNPPNLLASYAWNPAGAETDWHHNFADDTKVTAAATYAATCNVSVGVDASGQADPQNKISITGTCKFSGSIRSDGPHDKSLQEIPLADYSWYAVLQFAMDLKINGLLHFSVFTSSFDSPPTIDPTVPTTETWAQLSLSGEMQDYVNQITGPSGLPSIDLVDILGNLSDGGWLEVPEGGGLIPTDATPFVVPGSPSFLFSNPQFTANGDIAFNINYSAE